MAKRSDTVRDRVKRLRLALGYETQQEMADYLGVAFNRWNNVERGLPLGHDLAVLLCQRTGVTLDWLYFGRATTALPADLVEKLEKLVSSSRRRPRSNGGKASRRAGTPGRAARPVPV